MNVLLILAIGISFSLYLRLRWTSQTNKIEGELNLTNINLIKGLELNYSAMTEDVR